MTVSPFILLWHRFFSLPYTSSLLRVDYETKGRTAGHFGAAAVKNTTGVLLHSVDYFTVLLTGTSGIFVPPSFSTALAHSA